MDDFGDFTSFGEFTDGGNSSATSGTAKENAVSEPEFQPLDGELFAFDSFQGADGANVGNGTGLFADFSQFASTMSEDNVHIAGGVPFDIPPLPVSPAGENFHITGGVPFEIPPLPPDLSFDDVSEPEGYPGGGLSSIGGSVPPPPTTSDVSVDSHGKHEGTVQSRPADTVANGNGLHNNSALHPSQSSVAQNASSSSWGADFSSFEMSSAGTVTTSLSQVTSSSAASVLPAVSQAHGDVLPVSAAEDSSVADSTSGRDLRAGGGVSSGDVRVGGEEFGGWSSNAATTLGGNDFGEFGGFSSSTVTTTALSGGNEFGGFSSSSVTTMASSGGNDFSSNSVTTTASSGGNEFGEISSNPVKTASITVASGGDDFGEFGGFSSNSITTTTSTTTGGEEFGGFSSNLPTTTSTTTAGSGGDDFGEFGGFASNPTSSDPVAPTISTTSGGDDFGEFGGFSSNTVTTTSTTAVTSGGDDFGGFSAAATTTSGGDDFGEFGGFSSNFITTSNSGGDDFGEFGGVSSATQREDTGFADFSSAKFHSAAPPPSTAPPSIPGTNFAKSSSKVLGTCFSEFPGNPAPSSLPLSALTNHLKTRAASSSQTENEKAEVILSLWLVLQNCIDLTVPLHKFDKSFLQNCYYSSLHVDPMLISRPSTLAILTGMAKFEAPLGGATAMEDLRESFGFEGDMAQAGSPTSTEVTSPFRRHSEHSAALLDLSLPLSPNSPTRDSFTLTADLAGLDLNPQPKQDKKLTSIQELLLNERLVVNRSTWMDSQLAELGGGVADHTHREGPNSQPDTPRSGKKGSSMEFQLEQLGLDVSKTTLPKGSSKELSLQARSVLGRLPDLSFMGHVDRVEKTTHYSS